jgi:hypothetical protein
MVAVPVTETGLVLNSMLSETGELGHGCAHSSVSPELWSTATLTASCESPASVRWSARPSGELTLELDEGGIVHWSPLHRLVVAARA